MGLRVLFFASAILLISVLPVSAQLGDHPELEALKGLPAVQVRAEIFWMDAYPDDPTDAELQMLVENHLRKYGVQVTPRTDDRGHTPRLEVFVAYMNFATLYYHFGIQVQLWDSVRLQRASKPVSAAIWTYGGPPGGLIGGHNKRNLTIEAVNYFVCAYRAANPLIKAPAPDCDGNLQDDRAIERYKRPRRTTQRDDELIHAASLFDLNETKSLLDRGANVDAQDPAGWTPLLYAVRLNSQQPNQNALIKLLLDRGANPNVTADGRWMPLLFAVESENLFVIQALLARGADINAATREGFTPLMAAALVGSPETVRLLLARGANVNATAHGGTTLLALAVRHRDRISMIDRTAAYSKYPADPERQKTELLIQSRRKHDQVIQLLRVAGAKP